MAVRQLFIPIKNYIGVRIENIEFKYFSGFSETQKQKNIESLHFACYENGFRNILEVSTKSPVLLGRKLSAFNLTAETMVHHQKFTVEQAFQSSKVFENGGPYTDLLHKTSREAKLDVRLKSSGKLKYFELFGERYENFPPTLFYDWLYINTLSKNIELFDDLNEYCSFTDIEFNEKKSINCQAYSLALFISLRDNNVSLESLKDISVLKKICEKEYSKRWKNHNQ